MTPEKQSLYVFSWDKNTEGTKVIHVIMSSYT